MKPVLCFGDVCPDIIIPYGLAKRQKLGEEVNPNALLVKAGCGGSVGNTSVGIARQGVPVKFLGVAGDDSFGRMLRADLEREGVDVSLMRLSLDCSTVLILIIVDENGDRTTFAYPKTGASQHQIPPSLVPDGIEREISWFHSTGMTLRENPAAETQLSLMKRCHEANIPVSLDVNARIESFRDPLFFDNLQRALPYCSVILGSAEDEICAAAGIHEPEKAALSLQSLGKIVVARRGEQGAKLYHDGKQASSPAFPVPVSDTVGAGDAYNAGFICAVLKGASLDNANRHACATASYSVSQAGGHGTPTCDQLKAFVGNSPEFNSLLIDEALFKTYN
ncbi:MAG: sugar kinase [Clostridia bacterium]|nr:sugar kinase [Clostridia bacterium]